VQPVDLAGAEVGVYKVLPVDKVEIKFAGVFVP
jgi:hypothetical protein